MGTLTVKGGTLSVVGAPGAPGASGPIDRLLAALGQRTAGPLRVVFAGSSTTAGNNATTDANRYVNRVVAAMQAAYPSGGTEPAVLASDTASFGTLSTALGIHGYNAGAGGTNSGNYLSGRVSSIGAINPRAVVHMVGSNDFQAGMAVATYKANVQARIAELNAAIATPCVHVLVHSYQRLDVTTPAVPWADYGKALAEIAASDPANIVFIDLSGLFVAVGVPGADPANVIDADNIHGTNAAHQMMAEALKVALRIPATAATPAADTTAPTVPGTPVATAGQGSATATTSGSTDAVGVTAYRWRRNGATVVSGQTGTSMTDTGLPAGTAVFYTVSALDAAGNESAQSAASNSVTPTASSDTTAPTVPGTPTATAGVNSASVAFAASTDAVGVAGYRVYSSSDGYTAVAATGATSPITVGSLAAGTQVTFKVAAYDAAGNVSAQSAASNSVTPTAPAAGAIASDDFNRADGPLGSTPVGGFAWQQTPANTFSVVSNSLRDGGSSPDLSRAWIDDGQADGRLSCIVQNQAQGLLFRAAADGSSGYYFFWSVGSSAWRFGTYAANFVGLASGTGAWSAGAKIEVVMSGSNFTFYVNDVQVLTATNTTHTGTRHGVIHNANAMVIDSFSHTSATA